MIHCMIVDDEPHAIDLLAFHVAQTPFLELVAMTTSPVQALQWVHERKIELIFLDVQMAQMSGIEFMQLLQGRCKVILTTAYSQYALAGFDHEVVDYLLKPILFTRFLKSAQRALSVLHPAPSQENDYLFVKTEHKGKLLKINVNDIVYIQGQKNYIDFFTRRGERTPALLNLKDLEERLPAERFIRTHKSYILALSYIILIEGNGVHLEHTPNRIPIGDTYREAFMHVVNVKMMTYKP